MFPIQSQIRNETYYNLARLCAIYCAPSDRNRFVQKTDCLNEKMTQNCYLKPSMQYYSVTLGRPTVAIRGVRCLLLWTREKGGRDGEEREEREEKIGRASGRERV